jgi:transcription-repair coupling factor (superfamily II helicase)
VPVENIDILSRYGSSDGENVALDRLGGEAWQRRKARMKERIREIAGELIKTAAERALRPGTVMEPDTGYAAFVDRFPYERPRIRTGRFPT